MTAAGRAEPRAGVCVIIAAHDAAATIVAAIRSALAEPEVAEVVVVDDASNDATAEVARSAEDGTGRLRVIRLAENGGPSRARNVAISMSVAPWLAILDADDTLLPGRFARLFAHTGWELAADNIVMIPAEWQTEAAALAVPDFDPAPAFMSLAAFIEGNVLKRGGYRSEIGLLKPVISRSFLQQTGLCYEEKVRLGEDFVLYTRLMARGARFLTIRSCGYRAIQRPNSLSVNHRAADLQAFADASRDILATEPLDPPARAALIRQEAVTRAKFRHREFLDRKSLQGLPAALAFALQGPVAFLQIARGVLRDKAQAGLRRIGAGPRPSAVPVRRFLMPARLRR